MSSFSVASFLVTDHCCPDRYTMFWVLLLATKLTVSFYIEVKIHFFHLVYLPLSVDGSFGTFLPSCAIIIIIKEQNKFKCPTAWTMIFLKFILLWIWPLWNCWCGKQNVNIMFTAIVILVLNWSVSWWLLIFSYGFAWILVHGTQYVFPQSYSNIPTGAIPLSWMYKVLMHHWATAHCFYMSKAAKWLTYHPFVCVFNMVRVLSHLLLLSFISLLSCCRSSLWYSQPKI